MSATQSAPSEGSSVRYGSLFSGIEAASVAWIPLGWRCAWVAEIDPFASAVLAHRYPDVPNLGDVTRIDADAVEPVDLVVFGSPCQSFSVAGKRLGLDDPRGNMALVGLRVVGRIRPRWVVWENVPGVLSSDGGRDFGAFLGLLGELGYGFAYRVLDAQYFGVPQRRRRVFVVGYLGDWRPPAAVLFEHESMRGDSPPRREAGQGVAPTIEAGANSQRYDGESENFIAKSIPARSQLAHREDADTLIGFYHTNRQPDFGNYEDVSPTVKCGSGKGGNPLAVAFGGNRQSGPLDVATAVNAHGGPHGRLDFESETFVCQSEKPPRIGPNTTKSAQTNESSVSQSDTTGEAWVATRPTLQAAAGYADTATSISCNGEIAHSLRADGVDASEDGTGRGTPLVPIQNATRGKDQNGLGVGGDAMFTLDGASRHAIGGGMSVRRLTPVECERLQGFPDDYTLIPYRGKPAADGPRYRAIGNSMAVPVMRWIGHRIQQYESAMRSSAKDRAA